VDGLERDLAGRGRLFRVDRGSDAGRELASRYSLSLLPALVLFDGQGQVIMVQQGRVDRAAAKAEIDRLWSGEGGCSATPSPPCEEP
jgi:hypothetical protein